MFFVEAGTIHAIGKGNLIAEIQQNSNVTYRLYDYDRRDKNGNPRQLHIEKGVMVSNTSVSEKKEIPNCSDRTRLIANCEYFSVKELKLSKKAYMLNADKKSYHALVQTDGECVVIVNDEEITLKAGECLFVPAGMGEYSVKGEGVMLVASNLPEYYVGIDLGGTNIAAAVVDEYGTICGRATRKTNVPREYSAIFDDMASCAREAAKESGISFDDIKAVGIGCPGAIDKENANIEFSNNLGFYDVPITAYMEKTLGKKIYIENDASSMGRISMRKRQGCQQYDNDYVRYRSRKRNHR